MIKYFQYYLTLEEITKTHLKVFWGENGKYIGDFIVDDDGFFYFWPLKDNWWGCWASYILREIADKLDELNQPWSDQIDQYFEEQRQNNQAEENDIEL